jgi:dTDP-glucose 4,6-dehydratase
MERAIVTGGAGFIGSCLVRRLVLDCDHSVLNIDKLTYAANPHALKPVALHDAYRLAQADVCDGDAMRALLAEFQPDVVFHLAAESHVDRSIDSPYAFVTTNVVGSCVMLHAALDYWRRLPRDRRDRFRFIHVSTDEVYGSLGEAGHFSEASPYRPSSPYSASKAAADHFVRAWHQTYGLPTIVTNCSNNYGPHQFPEKLIPLMIVNATRGQTLPVYGTGLNVRDWLHVEDHAEALRVVAERGEVGETYNVGGDGERTNLDVVEAICDMVDELRPNAAIARRRDLIRFVADRPGHDRRYAIDFTKIGRTLGWRPQWTFDAGLRQTVSWYLDHEAWWRDVLETRYGGERLGRGALAAA